MLPYIRTVEYSGWNRTLPGVYALHRVRSHRRSFLVAESWPAETNGCYVAPTSLCCGYGGQKLTPLDVGRVVLDHGGVSGAVGSMRAAAR